MEDTTLSNPIWVDIDDAIVLLNDWLYDRKAKPDALVVDISCPLQLSKSRKQLDDVFSCNSSACVPYLTNKGTPLMVIGQVNFDSARVCEFERVLDQVEQHLLQSCLISVKDGDLLLDTSIAHTFRMAFDTLIIAWQAPVA